MFSKRSLPFLAVLLFAGVLIAFRSIGGINPPDKYEKILQQVTEMLEDAHYSPKKVDDAFSKDIFKKYLAALDQDKNLFLQSDIRDFRKQENHIDDEMHGAPMLFFPMVNATFSKRIEEASKYYKEILAQPFNYSVDESVVVDPEKLDYPANEPARRDAWRKRLKYLALERYSDLQEAREQNKATCSSMVVLS